MNVLRIPALAARTEERRPRGLIARARARRQADEWLRISNGRWEGHPAFAWRAAELTTPRERRILSRSLRGVASDAREPRATISASLLNRRGVAPHADAIEAVARRLENLERPVTAAGIVLVRDLLTDGCGPLYVQGRVSELPTTLTRIRSTLEAN